MDPAMAAGVMQGLAVVLGGVMSMNARSVMEESNRAPKWVLVMAIWLLPSLFLLVVVTVTLVVVLQYWPRM